MSNVNSVTIKAIRTNLIKIIKSTIKWKFEDGSTDGDRKHTYGASLDLKDFKLEQNHGQGPMYAWALFGLEVNREVDGKTDHQLKAAEVMCEIEENITDDALNIGDLETSQLVSNREIEINVNEPDSDALTVSADIKVFFRDSRT